jgi:hypothetical protein
MYSVSNGRSVGWDSTHTLRLMTNKCMSESRKKAGKPALRWYVHTAIVVFIRVTMETAGHQRLSQTSESLGRLEMEPMRASIMLSFPCNLYLFTVSRLTYGVCNTLNNCNCYHENV